MAIFVRPYSQYMAYASDHASRSTEFLHRFMEYCMQYIVYHGNSPKLHITIPRIDILGSSEASVPPISRQRMVLTSTPNRLQMRPKREATLYPLPQLVVKTRAIPRSTTLCKIDHFTLPFDLALCLALSFSFFTSLNPRIFVFPVWCVHPRPAFLAKKKRA